MQVAPDGTEKLKQTFRVMEQEREPWFTFWSELADFILPRRYVGLNARADQKDPISLRNPKILDGTGTVATRTLAAGMMNGITSPSRPWFRLRIPDIYDQGPPRIWLDEVQQRMMYVMAETNFYNGMATIFLDLACFNTAAMMIYEDDEDVFRCYNWAIGEYFFMQNNRGIVDRVGRRFTWRVEQIVNEFGLENCSPAVKQAWETGGAARGKSYEIYHLIEPNAPGPLQVAKIHRYREFFWEKGAQPGALLRHAGFRDWPGVTPRWETLGNDSYGTGPSVDALPDIKQLQYLVKRKAQALDKMVSPPLLADMALQNQPTSFLPNGITFVNGNNSFGVKPVYQVTPPIRELYEDIAQTQNRIKEMMHNDLFRMISQLEGTHRTATEIDARREEKLVLLGPVLERFENEGLDPALRRIFSIMFRKGLLPPVPPELADADIQIQYVSVLSDAQRAVGAAPIERYLGFLGNLIGVWPEVGDIPNLTETVLDYGERLGIPAKNNKTREEIAAAQEAKAAQAAQQQMAETAPPMADAAKTLSETRVGGGADALQQLLGA